MSLLLPFARPISVGLLLLLAVAAAAQTPRPDDRACRDDRGTDRCADAEQRRMRDLYGVPSIEEHRRAGDQVRRVFYVDGYGRDLVLLAFVRSPGRDPSLRVHYPRPEEGERPAPLQAPVPQALWDEVISRSAYFDRRFARQEPGEGAAGINICIHGWVYMVEAIDRPAPRSAAVVRRKVESACEDGPGALFAREVERLALTLLPPCNALDPDQHRNAAAMIAACHILHGDRLAAAEALNRAGAFRFIDGAADAPRLAGLFAHETRIDWNGDVYRGHGMEAGAFWAAHLSRDSGRANLFFERVEGLASDRVRVTGFLSRSADTPPDSPSRYETAPVEQVWVRDHNGDLQVEAATVGPWEAAATG